MESGVGWGWEEVGYGEWSRLGMGGGGVWRVGSRMFSLMECMAKYTSMMGWWKGWKVGWGGSRRG